MIEKEKLKKYAKLLMFDMDEEEYSTLQEEFDIILKLSKALKCEVSDLTE